MYALKEIEDLKREGYLALYDAVDDMVADGVDIEMDVLEDVQQGQLKTVFWTLVDALPENQGKVLRLRFHENSTT